MQTSKDFWLPTLSAVVAGVIVGLFTFWLGSRPQVGKALAEREAKKKLIMQINDTETVVMGLLDSATLSALTPQQVIDKRAEVNKALNGISIDLREIFGKETEDQFDAEMANALQDIITYEKWLRCDTRDKDKTLSTQLDAKGKSIRQAIQEGGNFWYNTLASRQIHSDKIEYPIAERRGYYKYSKSWWNEFLPFHDVIEDPSKPNNWLSFPPSS